MAAALQAVVVGLPELKEEVEPEAEAAALPELKEQMAAEGRRRSNRLECKWGPLLRLHWTSGRLPPQGGGGGAPCLPWP
jgi:hypothetical protein